MTPSDPGPALRGPERRVRRAFESAGAVSAATARPLAELPAIDAPYLRELVDRGLVREGPPGRFYFYPHAGRPRRRAMLRWALLLLLVLLGPVLFVHLTAPR